MKMKNLQKAEAYLKFIKNMNDSKDSEGVLEVTSELLEKAGACLLDECVFLRGNNKEELLEKIQASLNKLTNSNNEGTVYLVCKELENIVSIMNTNLAIYNIDLLTSVWQAVNTNGTTHLAVQEGRVIVYSVSDNGTVLSLKELYMNKFNKASMLKMLNNEISETGAEVDIMSLASQVMFLLTSN